MVAGDRGQVLLLGGLAIAIVFLTAIPLSNSLVVSESASSSETVDRIEQVEQREANVVRGLRTIMGNSPERNPAALNRSLQNFTRYYTQVSAQQDGVYVNATLNVAETEGNYTSDALRSGPDNNNYTRPDPSGPGNANDWDLAREVDSIEIFELTVTETNGGAMNAFRVLVTGDSGTTRELRAVSAGSATEIQDGSGRVVCSGTSVDIDFVQGECDGAVDGSFAPITDGLNEPYTVRFQNGNRADGTYTFASTGQFPDDSYSSTEYRPYGIRPVANVTFVGPDISYTRTIRVNGTS